MTENIFELTPLPVKKHKTGIVDADSIMYQIGWKLQAMGVLSHINLDQLFAPPDLVYREVNQYLEALQNDVDVDKLELHFTASNKNRGLYEKFSGKELRPQFRTQLGASYKDNRSKSPTDLPFAYHAILQVILESHLSFMHDLWEADDVLLVLHKMNPDYVMLSNDKDVWKQVVGYCYQYDKRKAWTHQTVDEANMFPFVQAITGDPTDGYYGAKGIGIKSIPQFLNVNMSPYELWQGVVRAHKSVGNSESVALCNMRMASLHQVHIVQGEATLVLFEPPNVDTPHIMTGEHYEKAIINHTC
jgi:hypothetical protein